MEYQKIQNWSGGKGNLLVSKKTVILKIGDQYIGDGMAGTNIFTWTETHVKEYPNYTGIKVIGRCSKCEWLLSGNNKVSELPIVDI